MGERRVSPPSARSRGCWPEAPIIAASRPQPPPITEVTCSPTASSTRSASPPPEKITTRHPHAAQTTHCIPNTTRHASHRIYVCCTGHTVLRKTTHHQRPTIDDQGPSTNCIPNPLHPKTAREKWTTGHTPLWHQSSLQRSCKMRLVRTLIGGVHAFGIPSAAKSTAPHLDHHHVPTSKTTTTCGPNTPSCSVTT